MEQMYRYDCEENKLYITGDRGTIIGKNPAVEKFCNDYNIELCEFNIPVIIEKQVIYCLELLKDCSSFNQPVTIGKKAEDCHNMFLDCKSLNQKIEFLSCKFCYDEALELYNVRT